MLRDHGQAKKYFHDVEGYNGRLDSIQAGLLRVKLQRLAEWNGSRQRSAARYRELLADVDGVGLPHEPSWTKPVYHLFVIRVEERDEVQRRLTEAGIGTGIHYPVPLHLQKAYSAMGHKAGDFPVTEKAAREILSLPMYPGLTEAQLQRVCNAVQESMPVRAARVLARAASSGM
jgi:dTDP-4-amino-4,6-dideoxygalactose transaminase